MHRIPFYLSAVIVLVLYDPAGAQFAVTDWGLLTAVQDLSAGGGQDTNRFITVLNPFSDAHSASLGPGAAMAAYDFSWSANNARFEIDATLVDPNLGSARYVALASGSIFFSTASDLRANLDGAFLYDLPGPGYEVMCGLTLYDLSRVVTVLHDSGQADTITSPSNSGIIELSASGMLAAGHEYQITYSIRIDAFGNSGVLATTDGHLQLTFEPVPEPTTIGLLGLLGFRLRHRRRAKLH